MIADEDLLPGWSDTHCRHKNVSLQRVLNSPESIAAIFSAAMSAETVEALILYIQNLINIAGRQEYSVSGEELEFLVELLAEHREHRELMKRVLQLLREIVSFKHQPPATKMLYSPDCVEVFLSLFPYSGAVELLCLLMRNSSDVVQMMLAYPDEHPEIVKLDECDAEELAGVVQGMFEIFNNFHETCELMMVFVENVLELCKNTSDDSGIWEGLNGLATMVQKFPETINDLVMPHIEDIARAQMEYDEQVLLTPFWTLLKHCAIELEGLPFMESEVIAELALHQILDPDQMFEILDVLVSVDDVSGLLCPHNARLIESLVVILDGNDEIRMTDQAKALKVLLRFIALQTPDQNYDLLKSFNICALLDWLEFEDDEDLYAALVMGLLKIKEYTTSYSLDASDFWEDERMEKFLDRVIDYGGDIGEAATVLMNDIEG